MENMDNLVDKDRNQVVETPRHHYNQVLPLENLLESEHLV